MICKKKKQQIHTHTQFSPQPMAAHAVDEERTVHDGATGGGDNYAGLRVIPPTECYLIYVHIPEHCKVQLFANANNIDVHIWPVKIH